MLRRARKVGRDTETQRRRDTETNSSNYHQQPPAYKPPPPPSAIHKYHSLVLHDHQVNVFCSFRCAQSRPQHFSDEITLLLRSKLQVLPGASVPCWFVLCSQAPESNAMLGCSIPMVAMIMAQKKIRCTLVLSSTRNQMHSHRRTCTRTGTGKHTNIRSQMQNAGTAQHSVQRQCPTRTLQRI